MKTDLPPCPVTKQLERDFAALLGALPKPNPIPTEPATHERSR